MSEFGNYLSEVFEQFGTVQSQRMFGGYGIYHDGLMFGLGPFMYTKNGKEMAMSYYQAPEAIFDDPDVAKTWARHAFDAALRTRKPGRKKKR